MVPSAVGLLLGVALGSWALLAGSFLSLGVDLAMLELVRRRPDFALVAMVIGGAALHLALPPFIGGFSGALPVGWMAVVALSAMVPDRRWVLGTTAVALLDVQVLFELETYGASVVAEATSVDRLVVLVASVAFVGIFVRASVESQREIVDEAVGHEATAVEAVMERDRELRRRTVVEGDLEAAVELARAANDAQSDFMAAMSHELRTPLAAIIGYAELLLEETAGTPHAEDVARVRSSGRHLLAVIDDILDLSRIEGGEMVLQPVDVDVGELVREVVETVRPRAEARGNTLIAEVPGDPGSLVADGLRVRQVLLNLLSNAAKFTEQGTVRLEVREVAHEGRPALAFEVADSGIGITPEQLDRLFQPFVQADASTSRRYGGTGLGLVLSRRFAEMMGGAIEVQSTPGEGSHFTLVVPRTPVEAA
ncbi:MAG: hypothetical protein H6734_19270 [Alphaproteobacteria bacterium]|nr:hypothetical protein [Alphaproteobacteria bacterium]